MKRNFLLKNFNSNSEIHEIKVTANISQATLEPVLNLTKNEASKS